MLQAISSIIYYLLDLYWFILVVNVIVSWLIAFNVINTYQPFVQTLMRLLDLVCEPVLKPIRRWLDTIVPSDIRVDLSPLVALILVHILQLLVIQLMYRPVYL